MVIDTSAIVAIALNEPEAETFEQRIADAPVRLISAATVLEASMVIETRLGEAGEANSTCGCRRPASRLSRSTQSRPTRPGAPGGASAKDVIPPV